MQTPGLPCLAYSGFDMLHGNFQPLPFLFACEPDVCELTNTRGMNSDPTNFQGLGLQGRHVFCEGTNWTPYAREPVLAIDSFAKTLQKESDVVL